MVSVPRIKKNLDESGQYIYTVHMVGLIFDWDERKNVSNRKKHGISFEEAQAIIKAILEQVA